MRMPIAIVLVSFMSLAAADAEAQVSIGVAVGLSHQEAGAGDSPYLAPGFGGTGLSGIGMFDAAIHPRVSLGGEISLAGDITGQQTERAASGSNVLTSQHHDTIYSGVLKFGSRSSDRVRAAAVVGGGIAQRSTDRAGDFQPGGAFPSHGEAVHEVLSDTVFAVTGGVDVAAGLNEHVALLVLGRVYILKDDDLLPDGVVHRGVSSVIYRLAGGVQIRF
jgi:hypothetical protein